MNSRSGEYIILEKGFNMTIWKDGGIQITTGKYNIQINYKDNIIIGEI